MGSCLRVRVLISTAWSHSEQKKNTSLENAYHPRASVDLDVVAPGLLHALGELAPDEPGLLRHGPEALLHAALHALEAAHVDVRVVLLHELPELVCVLGHLRLDVHLLPGRVLLLAGDRVVVAELVRVLGRVLLVLVVVEQGLGVGNPHEDPGDALELPRAVRGRTRGVVEEQAQVGAHGRDAGAGGEHDDVGLWVLRQQHLRARGASDEHVVADAHVADVVGADAAVDLALREAGAGLVRLVLADLPVRVVAVDLHHALHAE
mmetsp:Transcript_30678/g.83076  ORF Transcript_30678/g.83076 Transcript_30678/m.83076 type:complete len:263 (-) Transcript_30678:640-1428(-)